MRRSIRALDLFCGVGGSSHGAAKAGVQIVAGFDIWEPAIKVYSNNFPKARVFLDDIRNLNPKNIKDKVGGIDLILASPECTNHSVAKGARERNEESRRTAFQVTRFARVFSSEVSITQ